MRLSRLLPLALALAAMTGPAGSAADDAPVMAAATHARGYKPASADVLAARHAAAAVRHGSPAPVPANSIPAALDLRDLGQTLPPGDQGSCGSCYLYSTCRVASAALVRASGGRLKYDGSFRLSAQYGLDCQRQFGGCGGGDEAEVADFIKARGFPLESDYGPYRAAPQRCRPPAKLYKVLDFVYCTPGQKAGVASTADIKAALLKYGEVSTAIVADGSWDRYRGGVLPFNRSTPRAVDHAVSIVGWKDDPTLPGRGYWVVMNQWGDTWGDGRGCINVQYGSHQVGTEAFAFVCAQETPPAPAPPAPAPTPPAPPAGGVSPTILTAGGGVIAAMLVAAVVALFRRKPAPAAAPPTH